MPNWFEPTVVLAPFAAWMFLGVGLPWALALLPRDLWRERVTVIAVSMALGPLGLTAWMFVLGTWGRITLGGTLIGSAGVALAGAILVYLTPPAPLRRDTWVPPYGAEGGGKSPFSKIRRGGSAILRRAGQRSAPTPAPDSSLAVSAGEGGRGGEARAGAASSAPTGAPDSPLSSLAGAGGRGGEALLIAGIALVLLANVIVTAYWPFIAYDTQWVYGYNARIFILREGIPDEMGYYPQLIPLGYATMQQAWSLFHDPVINDHAARVIVPWFNTASVLMAYVLGRSAFQRRGVALLAAAVWALYPHVAAWAGAGDLEITLAFYMTGAAAFFTEAWRTERARFAVLSGVLLSGALWTKPTGGALALGVMLAVAGYAVITRFRWVAIWPKLRIALVMGIACAPLGGMWYVRNLALGHPVVEFPASYWHGFAQRSGQELGWPVLIAILAAGALVLAPPPGTLPMKWKGGGQRALGSLLHSVGRGFRGGASPGGSGDPPLQSRADSTLSSSAGEGGRRGEASPMVPRRALLAAPLRRVLWVALALALILIGALPSALNVDTITRDDRLWLWLRGDLFAARRLNLLEAPLIAAGFGLLIWLGRERWRAWPRSRRETILLLWALLLPYAVVWFFDFSYHYRLSFAIVPLVAVQVAALIDGWLWDRLAERQIGRAAGAALIVGVTALALAAGLEHSVEAWRDGGLPDDTAKYDRGNPGLMVAVHALEDYAAEHGPLVVAIPGEDRLPFFFPTWQIRNSRAYDDLPTRVEDLAGADLYIENSSGTFLMQRSGHWPNSLSADATVGALYYDLDVRGGDGAPWPTVLQPIPIGLYGGVAYDDGNFRYSIFTIHPEARATPMTPGARREDTAIIGEFAQFIGHDMVSLIWQRGEKIILTLYWRPTDQAPPPQDFSIYIHLLDADGQWLTGWDGGPLQNAYSTRFWRPGESLLDYWELRIPADIPRGPAQLRIGMYDPLANARLPVTVNGEAVGDGLTIETRIEVR